MTERMLHTIATAIRGPSEGSSDHPVLRELHRTHEWVDMTHDVGALARSVTDDPVCGLMIARDHLGPDVPYHRAVHVAVFGSGRALVEDTVIDEDRVRYRVYLLRPCTPDAPVHLGPS